MDRFDVGVIGAGLVGLSVARALNATGASVTILERHATPGTEQSTHNSQVIHSGLFVRPGTLRARFNLRGNVMLVEQAVELGVRVERCGTLTVAVSESERPRLERYAEWGRTNGVPGVEWLPAEQVHRLEPHLAPCVTALFAPSGGRIDTPALVAALDRDLERSGVARHYNFSVTSARRESTGWRLSASSGATVACRRVVNAAGIASDHVARLFGAHGFRIYPCLGEYARVRGTKREWIRSMVYGFPPSGYPGIGVHLTRSTSGELWIGPTATYQDSPVPPNRPVTPLSAFLAEAIRLLPGLSIEDLEPAPAGVRAKIVPPGSPEPFDDFVIREEPLGSGVLHLVGIESPGLTASPAIAEYVASTWWRGSPPS